MKTYEIESKLNKAIGKTITIQSKTGRLIRWEAKERTLRLVLDNQDINILSSDVDQAMETFQVVELPSVVNQTSLISTVNHDLKNILMDSINKVRENKDYIPQAQEVNNNVKSIIDLAKAEIEYMKVISYMNK